MVCAGCHSADVLPVVNDYCSFCSRLVTLEDVLRWRTEMVAPRKDIQEDREDLALRGVT